MIVFYDSLTGKGKFFAKRLGYDIKDIVDLTMEDMDNPMFLITRCQDFGKVPPQTLDFLDELSDMGKLDNLLGTAISGNKNWGNNYGKSGETIQEEYGVPLAHKFEVSGLKSDVVIVQEYIENKLGELE